MVVLPRSRHFLPMLLNPHAMPAQLLVVPGSGTRDVSGLRGEGSFEAGLGPEGERSITLDVYI